MSRGGTFERFGHAAWPSATFPSRTGILCCGQTESRSRIRSSWPLARSNALPKVHGDQANEVETSPVGRNDRADLMVTLTPCRASSSRSLRPSISTPALLACRRPGGGGQQRHVLVQRLVGFALDGDAPDAVALAAIRDARDRAGLNTKTAVEVEAI